MILHAIDSTEWKFLVLKAAAGQPFWNLAIAASRTGDSSRTAISAVSVRIAQI